MELCYDFLYSNTRSLLLCSYCHFKYLYKYIQRIFCEHLEHSHYKSEFKRKQSECNGSIFSISIIYEVGISIWGICYYVDVVLVVCIQFIYKSDCWCGNSISFSFFRIWTYERRLHDWNKIFFAGSFCSSVTHR